MGLVGKTRIDCDSAQALGSSGDARKIGIGRWDSPRFQPSNRLIRGLSASAPSLTLEVLVTKAVLFDTVSRSLGGRPMRFHGIAKHCRLITGNPPLLNAR
jgi:hypothetical protein